ncbi:MAG: hypothetical protein KDD10_25445 [Phaeodactylibacter sp.]|nr:hypothetical protein [Phaeodactylibacter sp.]
MNCIEGTAYITRQIAQLLEQIHPTVYASPLSLFNGSTLGQHFRHIFDFYDCLLRGAPEGVVDYASRRRDEQMETDPGYAGMAFRKLEQACGHLQEEKTLDIQADFSSLPEAGRPVVGSTVGRELMFAYDHAVHHLALIKIGLKEAQPEALVDEHLGVAPSTIKYRLGTVPNGAGPKRP